MSKSFPQNTKHITELVMAYGTEGLSRLSARTPATIGRLVMGNRPTEWRMARTKTDEVPVWHTIEGDPRSGRLPAQYKSAAVLYTNRRKLSEQASAAGGFDRVVPVGAFAIGQHVMVAELPYFVEEEQMPNMYYPDGEDAEVAMRLGSGPLQCTLGLHDVQENTFEIAHAGVHAVPQPIDIALLGSYFSNAFRL